MLTEKEAIRISKFLSLVLRHQPELIGLEPDSAGWVLVDDLLHKMKGKGLDLTADKLHYIVDTNNKKRFALSEDKKRIRASQGHSISVDLRYTESVPPAVLFHGTAEKNKDSIFRQGLQKMTRQHVHLSSDIATAMAVGKRHGKPVVLEVLAGKMHEDGYPFFLSANGVWLTNSVPVAYIRL
jgi:putative RNA 2'-phosphotransferase